MQPKILAIDWWIRYRNDRAKIPLQVGYAVFAYSEILNQLTKNEDENAFPGTWTAYAAGLHLDDSEVRRRRGGQRPTQVDECLGIATLLDWETSPEKLIPPPKNWLNGAVKAICWGAKLNVDPVQVDRFNEFYLYLYKQRRGQEFRMGATPTRTEFNEFAATVPGFAASDQEWRVMTRIAAQVATAIEGE